MNKLKLVISFFIFHSLLFSDGPFIVNTITEQDGLRNGPDYSGGIVYYPTDAEGPLPIIVMVPGFISLISSIEDWGPFLASYGVVTMFVNVNSIFDDPYERSDALLDGLISIKLENERIGSPLIQKLNTTDVAVGGWSMGGGGAQLAAQQEPSIKTVVALSAWLQNSNDSYNNNTPILFLSGQYDNVASNNFHTNVFYNNTPDDIDKLLFEISWGNHNTVCSPYNDEEMGLKTLYMIEKYLLDQTTNCESLIEQPLNASDFSTNIECIPLLLGDINQDYLINIQDIILLVNMILNNEFSSSGDLDFNGNINILDVIQLIDFILD